MKSMLTIYTKIELLYLNLVIYSTKTILAKQQDICNICYTYFLTRTHSVCAATGRLQL